MSSNLPTLKASQIKVGDKVIRENDHLNRGDHTYEVVMKQTSPKLHFRLLAVGGSIPTTKYAYELSAQGYSIIERAGVRIGTFCVRYW